MTSQNLLYLVHFLKGPCLSARHFIQKVSRDGGDTEAKADTIKDFADGSDTLGLAGGLTYADLTIAQGTGNYSNHTIISKTSTLEYLAIIENITASNVNEIDIVALDIS